MKDINEKYSWNLKELYIDENDPQLQKDILDIENKCAEFEKKWKKNDQYYKDPKVLAKALTELQNISLSDTYLAKPNMYIFLRKELEEDNPKIKQLYSQIYAKEIALANKLDFFFKTLIKKIKQSDQKKFLQSIELKDYRHSLEKAFKEKRHLLSIPKQKIISELIQSSSENWVKLVSELVSSGEIKVKDKAYTFESAIDKLSSKEKEERDIFGDAISDYLMERSKSAEYEINSVISTYNYYSKLKKYKSFEESAHLGDDLDSNVINAMVDSINKSNSIPNRFYTLYTKLLKQEKMGYHERSADIFEIKENAFPIDKSFKLVESILDDLNPKFSSIFKDLVENRRIDVFPRKGKSGGAFCVSLSKNIPTYILLNHNGSFRDVETIAHETGHAIHSYLSQNKQHPNNAGHSIATAESASTFFEGFVTEHFINSANDDEKFKLMFKDISGAIATIHRQIACYNFELELHKLIEEKKFLPLDEINKLFIMYMKSYTGESVEFTEKHGYWWIYWSHIRRPFYVYTYASGLLISKALKKRVKDDKSYINKVIEFLSAGDSDSVENIFKNIGVDITKPTFWNDGLLEIEKELGEFEALGKKLKYF